MPIIRGFLTALVHCNSYRFCEIELEEPIALRLLVAPAIDFRVVGAQIEGTTSEGSIHGCRLIGREFGPSFDSKCFQFFLQHLPQRQATRELHAWIDYECDPISACLGCDVRALPEQEVGALSSPR